MSFKPTRSDLGLADKANGEDNISFSPKAGGRVGRTTDVAAELTDRPRSNGHPLRGKISIAAHPSKSGRAVVVEVCLEGVRPWDAGRYEGTIAVYGPKITDFTYALVVTTKWPSGVAVAVIAGTVIFSALVFFVLGRNVPLSVRDGKSWVAALLGLFVGGLLAGLTYWSMYVTNDTWGADPQAQVVELVMASFSATVLGYGAVAAEQRRLGESAGEESEETG